MLKLLFYIKLWPQLLHLHHSISCHQVARIKPQLFQLVTRAGQLQDGGIRNLLAAVEGNHLQFGTMVREFHHRYVGHFVTLSEPNNLQPRTVPRHFYHC